MLRLWRTLRLFLWRRLGVPLSPVPKWRALLADVVSVPLYRKDEMFGAPLEWSLYARDPTGRLVAVEETCAWTGLSVSGATPIVDPVAAEIDYSRFGVRCCRCGVPIHVWHSGMRTSIDVPSCPPCRKIVKRAIRDV